MCTCASENRYKLTVVGSGNWEAVSSSGVSMVPSSLEESVSSGNMGGGSGFRIQKGNHTSALAPNSVKAISQLCWLMMYGVTTNARAAPIYDAAVTSPTCSQHEPHNHLSQQLAALFAWNEGADTLHGVCLALLRVSLC